MCRQEQLEIFVDMRLARGVAEALPFNFPSWKVLLAQTQTEGAHTGKWAHNDRHTQTHPPVPTIDPSTHRTHRRPSIHPKPNIPFICHYLPLSTTFITKQDFHQIPINYTMTNISPKLAYIQKYHLSGNHRQITDRSAGSYVAHR